MFFADERWFYVKAIVLFMLRSCSLFYKIVYIVGVVFEVCFLPSGGRVTR